MITFLTFAYSITKKALLLWHASWHEEEEFAEEGHEEPAPLDKAQTQRRESEDDSAASLGKVETEPESSAGVSLGLLRKLCFLEPAHHTDTTLDTTLDTTRTPHGTMHGHHTDTTRTLNCTRKKTLDWWPNKTKIRCSRARRKICSAARNYTRIWLETSTKRTRREHEASTSEHEESMKRARRERNPNTK